MKIRTFFIIILVSVLAPVYSAIAGEMGMTSPLMSEEKVEAMKKMMMEMAPDTLEASIARGEKLFYDTTLGNNLSCTSCATCHPKGGTIGGAADMEWKGKPMKVSIPTLMGAAAGFPKPIGPMKVVSTVGGQNNM